MPVQKKHNQKPNSSSHCIILIVGKFTLLFWIIASAWYINDRYEAQFHATTIVCTNIYVWCVSTYIHIYVIYHWFTETQPSDDSLWYILKRQSNKCCAESVPCSPLVDFSYIDLDKNMYTINVVKIHSYNQWTLSLSINWQNCWEELQRLIKAISGHQYIITDSYDLHAIAAYQLLIKVQQFQRTRLTLLSKTGYFVVFYCTPTMFYCMVSK